VSNNLDFVFKTIDETFLVVSRQWMADSDFRALIMAEPIQKDAQNKWFEGLPQMQDYKIWGIRKQDAWVGAFGLKRIRGELGIAEYWGYIYPKNFRGLGLGRRMFEKCRVYCQSNGIRTIELVVSPDNTLALSAYKKWGFQDGGRTTDGVLRMVFSQ
jgi:RimJ/RimL family protein N-acetyltransferase